ncbi:MAG: hypothetical protein EZS28_004415 [Streblomastix strix]|uniref:Uncharacterized protein n=1 Tax=Streblomastix strix TaxID=222440 RepID=A0A5J4WYC8_9EUKA|nr:MAG: hypothetical protein EZS28_004415 [Streblomastix strix]
MPIHVEQQEFSALFLFKDMYDKSSAVQVDVSGQLNMLDCEFQGTYILDNYTNSTCTNESVPEDVESHIDEVQMGERKKLVVLLIMQYTADGKKPQESIPADSADVTNIVPVEQVDQIMNDLIGPSIFSKIKQLVQKVEKGLQWANDNVHKLFIKRFAQPILGALGPVGQTIGKCLDVASSFLDYSYVGQLATAFCGSF